MSNPRPRSGAPPETLEAAGNIGNATSRDSPRPQRPPPSLAHHCYTWRFKPFMIPDSSNGHGNVAPGVRHIHVLLEPAPRRVRRAHFPPPQPASFPEVASNPPDTGPFHPFPDRTPSTELHTSSRDAGAVAAPQTLATDNPAASSAVHFDFVPLGQPSTRETAAPSLPIEIHEYIIDAMYPHNIYDDGEHVLTIRALANCALVCQLWRLRAQSLIFYAVKLSDVATLRKLADLLAHVPAVGRLVRKLYIVGWLHHSAASVVPALPLVVGKRLPEVCSLVICRSPDPSLAALREKHRMLPHLAIHPRFPLSFNGFAASLRHLHLEGLIFPSFADFSRAMRSASGIAELVCIQVRWSPPSMPPPVSTLGTHTYLLQEAGKAEPTTDGHASGGDPDDKHRDITVLPGHRPAAFRRALNGRRR
ncbi:hypothetical protein K466DRAFT_98821 [Polyporus arcularius HHB13444]|uniref:F-box domain-containing protein n=1 Tax=Polyporus arcularius HHB13444 TaxID=1314778 RepID=A0A5C3PDE8_9APHY|nr:hypothetical protein K466DRAFT_98821 [Polyporus arcularius HHB13444]